MSGYIKTIKIKDKNSKLMSFLIDGEKLLEKYKAISTKTEVEMYGHKIYTNLYGLNVPEDDPKFKSFTVISIDSLLVYDNKYYLQIYLDSCAYKIVSKQMIDYLDENLFED